MMTVEELKKEGAIYFEKVTDGMQQYENQIIRMNAFQAVDKFMEMWEMLGCKNMYVDFYYFTLPGQARQQIDTVLTYQELEYIHQMEHEEGQVLFPVNEILLSICAKLNATEMLFCTIYMTGDYPSTWWGNYGGEYVVFTEKEA